MNRLILSLALLGASLFPAAAQHYRGFFDATFTYPVSTSSGMDFYDDGYTLSGTTSHGVQLRNLFVGAGAGVIFTINSYDPYDSENSHNSYSIGIPVFADVRYDFFNLSIANLFIGCKLGYSFAPNKGSGIYMVSPDDTWPQFKDINASPIYDETGQQIGNTEAQIYDPVSTFQGLYIQPSIGVRFRLNATMGLNLTLSYLPLQMDYETNIEYTTYKSVQNDYGVTNYEILNRTTDIVTGKFWSHRLALSVGIDF